MPNTANLLIQKMWDVTIVTVQDARLVESSELESMGKELYRLVDEMDRKKIIIDFTKVRFLASAAIGVMTTLLTKCKAINGTFVICGMRPEIRKVFEIMGLTKIMKFAPDEKEALHIFGYTAAG